MEKLSTIQKRNNLNEIMRVGDPGPGGAYHEYSVVSADDTKALTFFVLFQKGPRKDENSRHGVLDCDLLEIVRDRLRCFQNGDYATRENEMALQHVEEALLWMNKRTEDRAERQVLGTMEK